MAEHMRPEGLSTGYFCMNCGQGGLNMYGMGRDHGMGFCPFPRNAELVAQLRELNKA